MLNRLPWRRARCVPDHMQHVLPAPVSPNSLACGACGRRDAAYRASCWAGAIVVVVGLIDDRVKLRGHQKLIGQTLAASVLIGSGLVIERFEIFNVPIDLGLLSVPITLFWLLGVTNAINLIDGIDGLATTIASSLP